MRRRAWCYWRALRLDSPAAAVRAAVTAVPTRTALPRCTAGTRITPARRRQRLRSRFSSKGMQKPKTAPCIGAVFLFGRKMRSAEYADYRTQDDRTGFVANDGGP